MCEECYDSRRANARLREVEALRQEKESAQMTIDIRGAEPVRHQDWRSRLAAKIHDFLERRREAEDEEGEA
jgi:hypothetical protein